MSEQRVDTAKEKIHRVFSYIRELTKLRTPPVSEVGAYEWSVRFSALPSYPTIQTSQILDQSEEEFDGVILRVKRPKETPCPTPPTSLRDWLENGWDKVEGSCSCIPAKNLKDSEGNTHTEKFDDDPKRLDDFAAWSEKRSAWQTAERPVREAAEVFASFFKLQGQLQRESEKFQLYLGDGHLVWNSAVESVDHPILLKKVELEFDSAVPEFIIRETDEAVELYTSLLRHHELDGTAILACKQKVEESEPHPLANGRAVEFFKFFIQRFFSDGTYAETRETIAGEVPAIYRDPILFLGNRTQGFAEALDKLIESLPNTEIVSEALFRIVGVDEKVVPSSGNSGGDTTSAPLQKDSTIDFLLTKPANREQERVITRLEQTGSVLVQGPPGTGKSHTIANIIGHLLASGKTVLVSSHTSKALRVVREKVVKPLQPLCVSVLENDQESKSQLEESINGIVSYLSRTDQQSLTIEISQLEQRRLNIKKQLEKLESEALEIRKGEYTDIVVAGVGTPPSEAARKVKDLEAQHGWIPGPVQYGSPIPLNQLELEELYRTNQTLPLEDERCIAEGLPDFQDVLSPSQFKELTKNLVSLDRAKALQFVDLWQHDKQDAAIVENILRNLEKSIEVFSAHQWIQKVVEDSKLGKERLQPWINLIDLIKKTNHEIALRTETILQHGPRFEIEVTIETIKTCEEISVHLRNGGSLSFFSTAFKSSWRSLVNVCKVDEGVPKRLEHFESLLALMESVQLRRDLVRRWERQVVNLGGPKLETNEPEIFAKSMIDALRLATSWTTSVWSQIESQLRSQGFNLQAAVEKLSINGQHKSYISQIKSLVEEILIPATNSRSLWLRLKYLEDLKEKSLQVLRLSSQKNVNSQVYINALVASINDLNVSGYEDAFNRYLDIKSRLELFERRDLLLKKMSSVAFGWAKTIDNV